MMLSRRKLFTGLMILRPIKGMSFPTSGELQLAPRVETSPTGLRHPGCTFAWGDTGPILAKVISSKAASDLQDLGLILTSTERTALNQIMGVDAGFGFFDDATPNAAALPKANGEEGDGTILLGHTMMRAVSKIFDQSAMLGVVAHEAAHLMQYRIDSDWVGGGPHPELHADFMGGWYLGTKTYRFGFSGINQDSFGDLLSLIGDCDFTSPYHHGTQAERRTAMHNGYVFARHNPQADSYNAYQAGKRLLGI